MSVAQPTQRYSKKKIYWGKTFTHFLLLLGASVMLYPLLWMISASLREPGLPPPRTVEWLPASASPGNYGAGAMIVWDRGGRIYERYTYKDLKLDVGLTARDFDPDNPKYNF